MKSKIYYIIATCLAFEGANFFQSASANFEEEKNKEDTDNKETNSEELDSPWDPRGD